MSPSNSTITTTMSLLEELCASLEETTIVSTAPTGGTADLIVE